MLDSTRLRLFRGFISRWRLVRTIRIRAVVESFSMFISQPFSMSPAADNTRFPRTIDVGERAVECRASVSAFVPLTEMIHDRDLPLDVAARIQRAVFAGLPAGEVTDVDYDPDPVRYGHRISCGIRFLLPTSFGGTHEALLTLLRDTLAAESIDMVCGPVLPPSS